MVGGYRVGVVGMVGGVSGGTYPPGGVKQKHTTINLLL